MLIQMSVFRKRKLEHVLKPYEGQDDLEEKYHQKLYAYEDLKEKEHREVAEVRTENIFKYSQQNYNTKEVDTPEHNYQHYQIFGFNIIS